ncbi:MAG: hypothetical protein ACRDQU_09260 [Pseudonocardiaceae bacterium]
MLYQKVRYFPKDFKLRRPNGRSGWIWGAKDVDKVLYRLHDVLAAIREVRTVYVVEGEKDADRLAELGQVGTCNFDGAAKSDQRPKWRTTYSDTLRGAHVVVIADNDEPGYAHAHAAAKSLAGKAASISVVRPVVDFLGADVTDHLDAGHGLAELVTVDANAATSPPEPTTTATPVSLSASRETFRRWLGQGYDIDAHDVLLCTLAAERLDGDPLWLLVISGSGNAKTETVQAAAGTGAIITSTISSEGALLSATPARDKGKHATGGLLRRLGTRGVLVIKDVTSILAMNRDTRGAVLAAFREIHDGHWARNVGTDGGRTLTWQGRVVVIGAVTTAWDRAHDVIAAMGDRFVVLRMDSTTGRAVAGRQAISNTGSEDRMRGDLAAAVAGVLAGLDTGQDVTLTAGDTERLLAAADLVTLARTGVDYDYRGNVIDSHAPEMPTRFAKQLAQLVRGGITLGMGRDHAMRLAIRCARDSMPPLRLAILLDVAANPQTTTHGVRVRAGKPRATVDRQLQSLHMLGLLSCIEGKDDVWRYRLSDGFDLTVLNPPGLVPEMSPHGESESREENPETHVPPTDISGTTPVLGFRPTTLMSRVSNYLATVDGGASEDQIENAVEGRPEGIRRALECLVADSCVTRCAGPAGGSPLYHHQRCYSGDLFAQPEAPSPPSGADLDQCCVGCGERLMLRTPGRTQCERCRLANKRTGS